VKPDNEIMAFHVNAMVDIKVLRSKLKKKKNNKEGG